MKERAITCLRPSSGGLHLGHWIGNIQPLIKYQYSYDCTFIFADLQMFNSRDSECDIEENIALILKQMIALGVDPNAVDFCLESKLKQSHLSEFVWLSDYVSNSRLKRMPVFKAHAKPIKMSMFIFPILQILDFLLTDATIAFSNTDNRAAIELTNEVFSKINRSGYMQKKLGHIELIHGTVDCLVGFDGQKMSKSKGNCINFCDDEKQLRSD